MKRMIIGAAAALLVSGGAGAQTAPAPEPVHQQDHDRLHDGTATGDQARDHDRLHDGTGTGDQARDHDRMHDGTGTSDQVRDHDRMHDGTGAGMHDRVHAEMHEAMMQHAPMGAGHAALPGEAMHGMAQRSGAEAREMQATRAAERHALRHQSGQAATRHPEGAQGQHGSGHGGMDGAAGECGEAAGAQRMMDMHGGTMDGHGGTGGMDGHGGTGGMDGGGSGTGGTGGMH